MVAVRKHDRREARDLRERRGSPALLRVIIAPLSQVIIAPLSQWRAPDIPQPLKGQRHLSEDAVPDGTLTYLSRPLTKLTPAFAWPGKALDWIKARAAVYLPP